MGRKSTKKGKGKASAKASGSSVGAEGDLRQVPRYVEALARGDEEAASALMTFGRDASYTVTKMARERGDAQLEALGRRLGAVPPEVETNLFALREASVQSLLAKARTGAPVAQQVKSVAVAGGAVAFFDPARIKDSLVRSGRPRKEPGRVSAGDVAWVGLPTPHATEVRLLFAPPPEGQPGVQLRLRIESGVVFVGPPEAADGPRMGEVRRDPFGTALSEHAASGHFLRVKPGTYSLWVYLASPRDLAVHLTPDPTPEDPLAVDFMALASPPGPVDASAAGE